MEKRLPKSIRKFIRLEKARIRREVLDFEKQKELIKKLYERIQPVKTYIIAPEKSVETKPDKKNREKKPETKNNQKQKAAKKIT